MDSTEHKNKITSVFDTASAGYDDPAMRYFAQSALYMVEYMRLEGGERLIDIATGTGNVAIEASRRLVNGSVTGVDISENMLDIAREKSKAHGLQNVNFVCRDMENMGFPDGSFDIATCAFGLFFLPDMVNGLNCISRVIKPGGRLYLTSFGAGFMEPQRGMLMGRLNSYGIEPPPFSIKLMDSPDKLAALLQETGYEDVRIQARQLGYYLEDAHAWLDIVMKSAFRAAFEGLGEGDLKRLAEEHMRELETLRDENGLWLDVEVLFTEARTTDR